MPTIDRSTYSLPEGHLTDPVLWHRHVDVEFASANMANAVAFGDYGTSRRLQTWGRDPADPAHLPHWLCVRGGLPLHTDPASPRWSCQLVLRSDRWAIGGWDEHVAHDLAVGSFYCLDTWTPHSVIAGVRGGIFLVACEDHPYPTVEPDEIEAQLRRLLDFVRDTDFTDRRKVLS